MRRITLLTLTALAMSLLVLGAGRAEAAFPGGNGEITGTLNVNGHSEIARMSWGSLTRITYTPGDGCQTDGNSGPVWSSDGTRIAFERWRCGYATIWTMDRDGKNLNQVATGFAHQGNPSWSPDGTKLAFNRWASSCGGIHTVGAGGGNVRQLTTEGKDPAWSPDGRKIVFVKRGALQMMNPDGSAVLALTAPPVRTDSCYSAGDTEPDWSPDSRSVVFRRQHPDGNTDIYSIAVSTAGSESNSTAARLTYSAEREGAPASSPDGRSIMFPQGSSRTYTMDRNGAGWVRWPFSVNDPDWRSVPTSLPSEPLDTPTR